MISSGTIATKSMTNVDDRLEMGVENLVKSKILALASGESPNSKIQ